MSKKILQAVREASVSIATCLDEPSEVSKKDLEHIQNQITKQKQITEQKQKQSANIVNNENRVNTEYIRPQRAHE